MPHRITDEIVAVAGHIVEVLADQARADIFDALIVEKGAQVPMVVDKGQESRILFVVVQALVMTPSIVSPYRLENLSDGLGFAGEETGKAQVAEDVKETHLLFGKGHERLPFGQSLIIPDTIGLN